MLGEVGKNEREDGKIHESVDEPPVKEDCGIPSCSYNDNGDCH